MAAGSQEIQRHTLSGLAAILLWSTTVALTRSLSEQVGSLAAAAAIYLGGGALSLGLSWRSGALRQLRQLAPRYVLGCGALFVLYMLALYLGIGLAADRHQALEIGLLNYLWPALTLLFSLPLLGNRATLWLVPGTLVALAGVFLVLTQGTAISLRAFVDHVAGNVPAYALGLTAAISWALYSNLARRWAPGKGGGAVPLFMLAAGGAFLLLRLARPAGGAWTVRAVGEVAFMGAATSLAYVLWDAAMRRGNALLVAAGSYFTPLFSTLVSCVYLGIQPGLRLWVGCLLIVVGSIASWRSVRAGKH